MLRQLPTSVRGTLALVAFGLNTLVWFPVLMAVTLLRVLVPAPAVVRTCRRAATWIAAAWIGTNSRGLALVGCMRWDIVEPADLSPDAWYLVTSNHQSWVDIAILQWLFNRRIPMLKFFLKKELFWVPLLGLAWWALEFPFMQRYPRAVLEKRPDLRRKDLDTTRRTCERFREAPVSVLNFVEGTRFSAEKRDRQRSPYRHLLMPRAGGIAQVVSSLGTQLRGLLDVTIVYPGGVPTFWHLISGQIPSVVIRVDLVPLDPSWVGRDYGSDLAFREGFQVFLGELWARKDVRIEALVRGAAR